MRCRKASKPAADLTASGLRAIDLPGKGIDRKAIAKPEIKQAAAPTVVARPDRAGTSRRLDPVTRLHWRAADADTALATAMLKALKRRAGRS